MHLVNADNTIVSKFDNYISNFKYSIEGILILKISL